jgi:maltose O-acetyltransferase
MSISKLFYWLGNASRRTRFLDPVTRRTSAYLTCYRDARLKAGLGFCGVGVNIYRPVCFESPEFIEIADFVSIAPFVHIWGNGGVRLGKCTMIASHTAITSVTHDYAQSEMYKTLITKPVEIGEHVWIGSHSVIMPGIRVGNGAVIGAGSIVTHDVPPFTIVNGVPARVVKTRNVATQH